MSGTREFVVRVHEEDGSLWGEVLDLPGCFASGDDFEELRAGLAEAISLYLNDDLDTGTLEPAGRVEPTVPHLEIDELRVKVPA